MPVPTVAVTCIASESDGEAIPGALFRARLDQTEIYQGFVVPKIVEGIANASGVCVLQLWPNALGVAGSLYLITAINPETGRKFLSTTASVPNSACNLHQILVQDPYPALDAAQQALQGAQSALAMANQDVILTHADAAATAADRLVTNANASSSTTNAGIATARSVEAVVSATASEASRQAIDQRTYPAPAASDPATRPNGSARQVGDRYFNTVSNTYQTFNGAAWTDPETTAINLRNSTEATARALRNSTEATALALRNSTEASALLGRGYEVPVAYAASINLTRTTQTVSYLGIVYAPQLADLPFTTSGTFETAKFRVLQGIVAVDLASASDPVKGSALVGFKPSGAGAVGRTVQTKLRETISVKDFGAVGDGVTDDRAAFVLAGASNRRVYVPAGNYFCSDSVTMQKSSFYGEGSGVFASDANSIVTFAAGKNGFYMTGQGQSALEDMCITSLSTALDTVGVGVKMSAHACRAENLIITNFGSHGLTIQSMVGENANNCVVKNVRAVSNNGDGFGTPASPDNNACTFDTCDASSNGGWGFNCVSASTVFMHVHASANTLGSFREGGSSSTYISPYSEAGGIFYAATSASGCTIFSGVYGLTLSNLRGETQAAVSAIAFFNVGSFAGEYKEQLGIVSDRNYLTGAALGKAYRFQNHPSLGFLFFNTTDNAFVTQLSTDDALLKHKPSISTDVGFRVVEGANKKQGLATLAAGSVVVSNTSVTASSRIFLTSNVDGGTPGFLRVSARTPSSSFTITSSSAADTSQVAFEIFEPGTATG